MAPATQASTLEAVRKAGENYRAAKERTAAAKDRIASLACSLRDLGFQRIDLETQVGRPLDSWIERENYVLDPTATVKGLRAALLGLNDATRAQKKALDALTDRAVAARRLHATLPTIAAAAQVTERYAQQLVLRGTNGHEWANKTYRKGRRQPVGQP